MANYNKAKGNSVKAFRKQGRPPARATRGTPHNSCQAGAGKHANVKRGDKSASAAKVILNRPLYSSSTEALATLKWLPLEKRRFQRRCVHVYKCINGLINHDMDLIRQDVLYRHNTRNKGNFRLPRVKRNWGMQRTQYHAVSDLTPSARRSKTQGM